MTTGASRRCAFLTRGDDGPITSDDALAARCLEQRGVEVVAAPWRGPVPEVELVVVRSPWDYKSHPEAFLGTLREWSKRVRIANHPELIAWNAEKTYLNGLAETGAEIVPTRFLGPEQVVDERALAAAVNAVVGGLGGQVVIKPTVGASAEQTYAIAAGDSLDEVASAYRERPGAGAMLQPRVQNVSSEGEFSVLYFGGVYSHTVLKTPRAGDFRVQEEYGGRNVLAEPEPELLRSAQRALEAARTQVPGADPALYARVDLVRSDADRTRFWLMELELIEPALLLGMHPDAPQRFADAIAAFA